MSKDINSMTTNQIFAYLLHHRKHDFTSVDPSLLNSMCNKVEFTIWEGLDLDALTTDDQFKDLDTDQFNFLDDPDDF